MGRINTVHAGMRGTVVGPTSGNKEKLDVQFYTVHSRHEDVVAKPGLLWSVFPSELSWREPDPKNYILPGGYKVGDTVYSLRPSYDAKKPLTFGMRGKVTGPSDWDKLMVQFERPGGRWIMLPSQICRSTRSAVLPGGYRIGEVVYCRVERAHAHNSNQRVLKGMRGVIEGADGPGKLLVKWDAFDGGWGMLPTSISRVDPNAARIAKAAQEAKEKAEQALRLAEQKAQEELVRKAKEVAIAEAAAKKAKEAATKRAADAKRAQKQDIVHLPPPTRRRSCAAARDADPVPIDWGTLPSTRVEEMVSNHQHVWINGDKGYIAKFVSRDPKARRIRVASGDFRGSRAFQHEGETKTQEVNLSFPGLKHLLTLRQ